MHNKGFVRQAYRTGERKQTPWVEQQRAQCGIPGLGIVSSLHHNDINTCPLHPPPSHPPPLDQDLDTITHPGDMITPDTALSLFCPGWQQQHATCLCLNRDKKSSKITN